MQYSTAKAAILGLSRTLAIEGKKYGIVVNTVAPSAGTAMTSTIWPQEMVDAFKVTHCLLASGLLSHRATLARLHRSDRWLPFQRSERGDHWLSI
jgi:multifunctional beta-oxidation protein